MNATLWLRLAAEGNFDLIARLSRVEAREAGYGSLAVPEAGFSPDDTTHNMVLDFLKSCGAQALNPGAHIRRLEDALHGRRDDE